MSAQTNEQAFSVAGSMGKQGFGTLSADGVQSEIHFADNDITGLRIALHQAQTIIRSQQERLSELEETALIDGVTGLFNRRFFMSELSRQLSFARRDIDFEGFMILMDLENSRAVASESLCAIAEILCERVRLSDTVARVGSDCFAILMPQIAERAGLRRLARLEKMFARFFSTEDKLFLNCRFGSAAYNGLTSLEAVVREAEGKLMSYAPRWKKAAS